MKCKHPGEILTTVYDRGSKCLDTMTMSKPSDDRAKVECRILPFYHGMPPDHHSSYVDFHIDYLFTNAYHADVGTSTYKRFTNA